MSPSPEDWSRVAAWFDRLAPLPPAQRGGELARLAAEDPSLASWVSRLLAADEKALAADGPAGAPATEAEPARRAGSAVGRYVLLERIGRGGFGEVYRARDPVLDREVAVKVGLAGDAEERARFAREARIAADLVHPNVCRIYDFGFDSGQAFLVEELLDGDDLSTWIGRRPEAPLETRLRWLGEILAALAAAHRRGIVHRDVKPSNLRVTAEGAIRVLDFGIAGRSGRTLSEPAAGDGGRRAPLFGTVAYMAPERVRGEEGGPAADVYSWGAVAWELLAGRRRLRSTSPVAQLYEVLEEAPTSLARVAPSMPPRLAALVGRCLEADPERRPGDAASLEREYRLAVTGAQRGAGRQLAPARGEGARPWAHRWRAVALAGAAAAALAFWLAARTGGGLGAAAPPRAAPATVAATADGAAGAGAGGGAPAGAARPAVAPAEAGRLLVDARPWAWIESLERLGSADAAPPRLQLPPNAATPWAVALPPGRYRVTLRSGRAGSGAADRDRQRCVLEVAPGGAARCDAVFEALDPRELLAALGQRRLAGEGER